MMMLPAMLVLLKYINGVVQVDTNSSNIDGDSVDQQIGKHLQDLVMMELQRVWWFLHRQKS